MNLHGRIIPAVDMRRRFRLPARPVSLTDRLIITHTLRGPMALLADAVDGIADFAQSDIAGAESISSGLDHIEGAVRLDDGLILIHDPDRFLSTEETARLERAMEHRHAD